MRAKRFLITLTLTLLFLPADLEGEPVDWEDYFYLLFKLESPNGGPAFGECVYLSGDLNLDGYGEILIGAKGEKVKSMDGAGRGYVFSGLDGGLLYTYEGENKGAWYGVSTSGIGDTDGDGYPEFLFGAQNTDDGQENQKGKVYQYSGKEGSLIKSYWGETGGDAFGSALEGLGDVDGDGIDDFIVGAYSFEYFDPKHVGAVYIYSGASKEVIYKYQGTYLSEYMGYSVCKMGDLDKDSHNDFAYLLPFNKTSPITVGIIYVRSGKDGSLIREIWGQESRAAFLTIAYGGDVNHDGWPDLLVGQPFYNAGFLYKSGRALVFSGKDWSLIYDFKGIIAEQRLGWRLSTAGDVNGDDYEDILIGAPLDNELGYNDGGAAYVYSGMDGSLMGAVYGEEDFLFMGIDVQGGNDVNGDGLPDLVIGTSEKIGGFSAGSALVYVTRSLQALDEVPLGGTLELNLRVPAQPFGAYYLGFSLGTDPGIPIGTRRMPLNWDLLFTLTFGNPLFSGTLDGNGKRQILLPIPNDPALSGLVFYAAFLTLDPQAPKGVKTISNPEMITLQ